MENLLEIVKDIRVSHKAIPEKIESKLCNITPEESSWDLFREVFIMEKERNASSFWYSASIAKNLLMPKIIATRNKTFEGNFKYDADSEYDLMQNILMAFNDALTTYDETKGKFPVYSASYILGAVRETYEQDLKHYDRKKIIQEFEEKYGKEIADDELERRKINILSRPDSLERLKEDAENGNGEKNPYETMTSGETVEKSFEKREKNRDVKTMFNFFRLCADSKGNVDTLEAFNLWNEFTTLFKNNEKLYEEFKSRVNIACDLLIDRDYDNDIEIM